MATTDHKQGLASAIASTISVDVVLEYVQEQMSPMDVFDREQLEQWATANGWTPPPPPTP